MLLLGFDSLLEAKRISDLATLYRLLSRIKGGLDELCKAFSNYVKVSLLCVVCVCIHPWVNVCICVCVNMCVVHVCV